VGVGNATEETFRNQDITKVGRSAAKATGSSRPFLLRLPAVRSHRPPVRASKSWRPQRAPSEAHFPQEATIALTPVEGRWERDGNHQKKAMKTKSHTTQKAPGLRVRSSIHQSEQTIDSVAPAPVQNPAPAQTPERPKLPPINFARRRANRELTTERVIQLLKQEAPRFLELAQVVGKWVWIQFSDKQPRQVTSVLAELGFHWNNKRQVWQHPCGALTEGTESDPREKYPTYFPSDAKPA
jgi:hypothetical protein